MKRRTSVLLCFAAALGLAGCASHQQAATPAPVVPDRCTSLAAGDLLGQLVFAQPISLGPTREGTRPIYAEVPTR